MLFADGISVILVITSYGMWGWVGGWRYNRERERERERKRKRERERVREGKIIYGNRTCAGQHINSYLSHVVWIRKRYISDRINKST